MQSLHDPSIFLKKIIGALHGDTLGHISPKYNNSFNYIFNCCNLGVDILYGILAIFFLFVSLSVTCGTNLWLRNHDLGASKSSKSPGDRTWPEPHQPLTWMDFLSPQVLNR
jgi:hypothetical protein